MRPWVYGRRLAVRISNRPEIAFPAISLCFAKHIIVVSNQHMQF